MSDVNAFVRRMRALGFQVETKATKLKRKVALIADRELVLETPVDTGRARSNWIVSLGIPALSPREPYAPGEKLGKGERNNAQAALDQGSTTIDKAEYDVDIYITNNVSYIGKLNDGSSAQAPAGFVEAAVTRAVGAVKGARLL